MVARTQSALLGLLSDWSAETWPLLQAICGDGAFRDAEYQDFAFSYTIQLSAGTADHFDLRLALAPHSLRRTLDDDLPRVRQLQIARAAFDIPDHCAPEFLRRLLREFPTAESLCGPQGKHAVTAWLKAQPYKIDKTEGLHNRLRNELKSDTGGRRLTPCCNRVVVKQVLAEHAHRCPCPGSSSSSLVLHDAGAPAPEVHRRRLGGSVRMTFHNHEYAHYQQVVAPNRDPNRPLTDDERKLIEEKIANAWRNMSESDYSLWKATFRHEQAELRHRRALAALPVPPPVADAEPADEHRPPPPPPLFLRAGDVQSLPFNADEIKAARARSHRGGYRLFRRQAQHDDHLFVQSPVPARVSSSEKITDGSLVGCGAKKRNVCLHVLEPALKRKFNELRVKLNAFVKSLGRQSARSTRHVIMFQGSLDDPAASESEAAAGSSDEKPLPFDAVGLLCLCRYQPVVQIIGRYALTGDCAEGALGSVRFKLPPLPCVLQLTSWTSRLSDRYRSLRFTTSETFLLELARTPFQWALHDLTWHRGPRLQGLLKKLRAFPIPFCQVLCVWWPNWLARLRVSEDSGWGVGWGWRPGHSPLPPSRALPPVDPVPLKAV